MYQDDPYACCVLYKKKLVLYWPLAEFRGTQLISKIYQMSVRKENVNKFTFIRPKDCRMI